MANSEVLANAPLQLVVCEFRIADNRPGHVELDRLRVALDEDASVEFSGPDLRVTPAGTPESMLFQVVNSERTVAASVWPSSLAIEDGDYVHFEAFKERLAIVFSALYGDRPRRCERIGLRYVDELHPIPAPRDASEWTRWVHSSLLALPNLTGKRVSALGGGLTVDLGNDYAVNFRYATAHGPVVQSANLRLRPRPSSAALMLDTDAFWQPSSPEMVDSHSISAILDRLHAGVRELFDIVITEESRDFFRAREPQL